MKIKATETKVDPIESKEEEEIKEEERGGNDVWKNLEIKMDKLISLMSSPLNQNEPASQPDIVIPVPPEPTPEPEPEIVEIMEETPKQRKSRAKAFLDRLL